MTDRDSAIIYKDLFETIEEYMETEQEKAEAYAAYCRFVFYGEEYEGENRAIKLALRPYLKKAQKAGEAYQKKIDTMNANREKRKKTNISNDASDISNDASDISESVCDISSDNEYDCDSDNESRKKEKGVLRTPKKKPGHSPAADQAYFPLDDELNEAFKDFLEVRKKQKTPNTPHAVGLLMNQLTKLSADREEQLKIIQQSTMRGWKGLFPLKDEKPRAAPGNVYADLAEDW